MTTPHGKRSRIVSPRPPRPAALALIALISILLAPPPPRRSGSAHAYRSDAGVGAGASAGGGGLGLGPSSRVPSSDAPRRGGSASAPAPAPAPGPDRPLSPPFPDGLCGGSIVTIPPEDTYGIDPNLSGGGVGGPGRLLLPPRPIGVWLPPDYEHGDGGLKRRHPVLYCHDGQNAIEDSSSWTGSSWRLAGALTRLAERNMLMPLSSDGSVSPVPIVVLLPSAEGDLLLPVVRRRHLEYGDTANPVARAHADLVCDAVKPLVDSLFRTVPAPEATFAMGSSLGGQASYHLVMRRPDVFGGAAALSPAFQPATVASAVSASAALRSKSLYMDNGGDVDEVKVPFFDAFDHLTSNHWWNPGYFWLDTQLQPGIDAMRMALDWGGVRYGYGRAPGARHNERAWAQRIDRPLVHLYGRR